MKTQKFFMALAAIAALTLSSCSQEEELLVSGNNHDSLNDPNAVQFGTYMGKAPQSRAAEMNTNSLKTEGFGVYAYYTGTEDFATDGNNTVVPNFMCNQLVEWDDKGSFPGEETKGIWSYSPVKYWPDMDNEKVSFFAYAPYTANAVAEGQSGITSLPGNSTTGDPKISYVLSEDPGEQIDLLYAGDMPNLIKPGVKDQVLFEFYHAMTRIGFERVIEVDEKNPDSNDDVDIEVNAKNSLAEGTTVTITKVSLTSTKFNKSGELNLRTGKWGSLVEGTQSYKLTDDDFTEYKTADKTNSHLRKPLNNDDNYLMIFPTTGEIPIDITVEFDVTTTDTKLQGEESKITSQVTTSFDFKFEQGKFYNFVLHIGLTSVKLEAKANNWDHKLTSAANSDDAEIVVNSPYSETVSLIYDANGGEFRNGSSQFIISTYVGNFPADDADAVGHDSSKEAKFIIRDFKNDDSDDDEIFWKDEGNFQLFGWTVEKTDHEEDNDLFSSNTLIYGAKSFVDDELKKTNVIFVERTDATASLTIHAWWAAANGH